MTTATASPSSFRVCAVSLDGSFGSQTDRDQKHEQAVAILDLLDNNSFAPVGLDGGPYRLCLALADRRLVMSVIAENGAPILFTICRSPHFAGFLEITALCATATRMQWLARCPRGSRPSPWDAGPFTTKHPSCSENASDVGSMSIWRPPVGCSPFSIS